VTPQEDTTALAQHVAKSQMAPQAAGWEAIAGHLRRSFDNHPVDSLFEDLERLIVTEAYQRCGGNQVQSAQLLGVTRNVIRTASEHAHGLFTRSHLSELAEGRNRPVGPCTPQACESSAHGARALLAHILL